MGKTTVHAITNNDRTVTGRTFGIGNGSRLVYNLAGLDADRALLHPSLYQTNWQGGARTNLLLQSSDFNDANWGKIKGGTGVIPAVTPNYGIAPDGTLTADRVIFDAGDGTTNNYSIIRQAVVAVGGARIGATYCGSVWLKTTDGSTKQIGVYDPDRAPGSAKIATVTGTWTRFANTPTASGVAETYLGIVCGAGATYGASPSADLLVWGAQNEESTYPTAYIPTTSSAVTVYDVSPTPLYGVARTNLVLQSQTLNTTWTKSDVTIGSDAAVAPDGTTTADKLIEAATTANHFAGQSITPLASTQYTGSFYIKAGERTWALVQMTFGGSATYKSFDLTNGVVGATTSGTGTATITSVGNGWYRCTLTNTTASTVAGEFRVFASNADSIATYLGDITKGIYVWGAQVEVGTIATGYIPTTTAGASQTVTDYSTAATGVVTFATAPAAGVPISYKEPHPPSVNVYRHIGLGDGTSTTFSLPWAYAVPNIYVNGVLKTLTSDYTVTPAGVVTFGVAPAANAVLTWTGLFGSQR